MSPIIIWGLGQLGGFFGEGFLKIGHPVLPIRRGDDPQALAARWPEPAQVLIAVGEDDLPAVLASVPVAWRKRLALLQNELVPATWRQAGIDDPTVAVIWFERKMGRASAAIRPSPLFGPGRQLLVEALAVQGIAAVPRSPKTRDHELALKTTYIWTLNLAGLRTGGTAGALFSEHADLARAVATEAIAIQQALLGVDLDPDDLLADLAAVVAARPEQSCRGRSAAARLARALAAADEHGLAVPTLRSIQASS